MPLKDIGMVDGGLMERCNWGNTTEKMIRYHDEEWGIPVHDDVKQFEFLKIVSEEGSFDAYLWKYSDGKTILYRGHDKGYIPAKNELSERISKDLKKRGFKYLGPVVVYSHLQACGMINDHTCNCFRYKHIMENYLVQKMDPDNEV